jgi:hypothetical protein
MRAKAVAPTHRPNRLTAVQVLYVFTKGDADNLSAEGKKAMRNLAQQIRNEYP